jgi:iron complex outermembrane receptor protein
MHLLSGAALLTVFANGSATCWAQAVAEPEPEQPETQIEAITVTARSRAENIQKVPDAITAFSASAIESRGIEGIGDVIVAVPNLSIAEGQNPGTVTMSVRGVSQVRNGEAPVAIVIDGVQLSSPNQITQELFDIQRIEVLKGPQGALYGRNAIAGAINIVTKAPTDTFEGWVSGEIANGEEYKMRATLSGPIVPGILRFRASVGYSDFDGVLTNEYLDKKVDFRDEINGRVRLIYTPTERLTVDVRGSSGDVASVLS